jgi:predicted enzyme related to lactoylglutathione lyase
MESNMCGNEAFNAPCATLYVTVASLDETEKAVAASGGEIMVSKVTVERDSFRWFKVQGDFFIAIWEDTIPAE